MGELPVVVHQKLVYEYRDVLSRPEILSATGLSWPQIEVVLGHLVAHAEEVEVRYLWRPNLKDESDSFILEIAIAAWPCTIVTHNSNDFRHADLRFPEVAVCTLGQVLQSLMH